MVTGYNPQHDVLKLDASADDDVLFENLIMRLPCNLDLVVEVRDSKLNYPSPKPFPPGSVGSLGVQQLWQPEKGVHPAEAYVRIRAWQSAKSEGYLQNRYFLVGAISSAMHYGKGHYSPWGTGDHALIPGRNKVTGDEKLLHDYVVAHTSTHGYWIVAWTPYGRIPVDQLGTISSIRNAMNYWRAHASEWLLDHTTFEICSASAPLVGTRVDVSLFADLPMISISKMMGALDSNMAGGYSLVVIDPNGVRMAAKNSFPMAITEAIRVMVNQLSEEGRRTTSFWVAPSEWPLMKVIESNTTKEKAKAKVSTLKKGGPQLESGGVLSTLTKIAEVLGDGMPPLPPGLMTFKPKKPGETVVISTPKSPSNAFQEMAKKIYDSPPIHHKVKALEDQVDEAEKKIFSDAGLDDGINMDGVFVVSPKKKKIEPLGPEGVPITSLPKLAASQQPAAFKGKLFCLTGTLSADRDKIAKLIEFMGGKFKNSVTQGTKVLVIGTKPGATKVAAAKKFGVSVWAEMEFWNKVPENIRLQFFKENSLAMVMQWSKPVDGSVIPDEPESAPQSEPGKPPPAGGRKVILD